MKMVATAAMRRLNFIVKVVDTDLLLPAAAVEWGLWSWSRNRNRNWR
jgi:hypothetical protein